MAGRLGGLLMHATNDTMRVSQAGRDAANARFERTVRERFPDLPEHEVARRAALLRKAFMAQIALKSMRTRRERGTP